MRFTRSPWFRGFWIAPIVFGLSFATLVIVRATRALHQAQHDVRDENRIRFTQRQLPVSISSEFEFFHSPPSFQQAVLFDGHVFLVSSSALTELDETGAVNREFTSGRELPPGKLVAGITATLADARVPEIILATENAGLLTFDGHSFHQILPERADARAITAMTRAGSGRLLLGTKKSGVLVYDSKVMVPLHPTLQSIDVTTLAGDDTDLWVGTLSAGVFHYHAGQTDHFTEANGLPDPQVLSIVTADDATYVGTPVGIAVFDAGKFLRVIAPTLFASSLLVSGGDLYVGTEDQGIVTISLKSSRTSANTSSMAVGAEIRQLLVVNDSILAVGREGVYRKMPHAASWQPALKLNPSVLSDRNISALARDGEGHLWIGYFDRGVDILAGDRGRTLHIEDEHVFCVNRIVLDDRSNTVNVATANGLVRMNQSGSVQQVLTRADGLIADHVTDVALFRKGLAVATPAGLTLIDASGARSLYAFQGLANNHVYTLGVQGDELLAGTLGGISQLRSDSVARNFTTTTSTLRHNWITAIVPVGNAWMIGTYGDGVVGLDPAGTFRRFETASDSFEVNPNAMLVTPAHVFVGTLGRGLYVYERESSRWRVIDHGLPSLNVTAMAAGDGNLYIGTDNGLVRVREHDLHP